MGMKLHPRRLDFVAQEAVDLERTVAVDAIDGCEDVELDAVLLQEREPAHHLVERSLAALVDAIGVVKLARPVDAQPDEKVVLFVELAPLVGQQRTVGLHGVLERHARLLVLLLESDRAAEEIHAHDRRLAALPRHRDLVRPVALD